jgi:hypothetical protein
MTSIMTEVYRTYPITKREKCCALLKAKMEAKRLALKNRLMNDRQGEKRVCGELFEDQSEVSENSLS